MNRLIRLFSILNYLIYNKRATAKELAEKMNVSLRTIHRDVDLLSSMDIPIYIKSGRNGGIHILESYTISKSLISEEEQKQLLQALNLRTTIGLSDNDKLKTKISNTFSKKEEMIYQIDFSNWGKDTEKEKLDILYQSIEEKKTVSFIYYNNKQVASNREVIGIELNFKKNDWYLTGYCLEKQEIRIFKIKRMNQLVSKEKYQQDLAEKAQKLFENNEDNMEYVQLELKILKDKARRLQEEIDFELLKEIDDKYQLVTTFQPVGDWLINYLLSFGADVEIVSPSYLRESFISELKKMGKIYFL